MSKESNKCKQMKKTILRNAEQKPNCANVHVFTEQQLERAYKIKQQQLQHNQGKMEAKPLCEKRNVQVTDDDLLRKPRPFSSRKELSEIEALKSLKGLQIKDQELTPNTRARIAPALTKKMNFAPDQVIYKNLISLNVNDSILLPKTKPNLRKKYERTETNRLPVPDLADFLEPLPILRIPCSQINWQPEFISPTYDCFDACQQYYGCFQHPYFC